MQELIIAIDAGHGGCNPENGAYTTAPAKMWDHKKGTFHKGSVFLEGVFNRQIANKLANALKENGIKYEFLHHEWQDTSLGERVRKANSLAKNANCLLVSIHGNAAGTTARGLSVFAYNQAGSTSREIANDLGKRMTAIKGINTRKETPERYYWEANFYMLRQPICPAILSENGFFTNYEDATLMMSEPFQNEIVRVHLETILKYKESLEKNA